MKKQKEPEKIEKKLYQVLRGLEWVEEKSSLDKTYCKVTDKDQIQTIHFDGYGIKYHAEEVREIFNRKGTMLKKGTFDKIQQEVAKTVKGFLERKV